MRHPPSQTTLAAPNPELFDGLPSTPGVYRFFGARDELLYIGKSINIRQRVKGHFAARNRDRKEQRLCQQTVRISHTTTAAELGALLLENREIKRYQPIFNRRQRRHRQLFTWRLVHSEKHHLMPRLLRLADLPQWPEDSYGLFRSPRQAQQTLLSLVNNHRLCPQACGLEQGHGACFSYQLKRCGGVCCGEESVTQHNQRVLNALQRMQIKAWPFEGAIWLHDHGETTCDYHLVHNWCHLTTSSTPVNGDRRDVTDASFDLDSYRLLVKAISQGMAYTSANCG